MKTRFESNRELSGRTIFIVHVSDILFISFKTRRALEILLSNNITFVTFLDPNFFYITFLFVISLLIFEISKTFTYLLIFQVHKMLSYYRT